MTKKKEHPHAWVLREIADGAPLSDYEVNFILWVSTRWANLSGRVSNFIAFPDDFVVRRKQKMHRIGEHTFPAPMTEAPAGGSYFWHAGPEGVRRDRWDGHQSDFELLALGVLHATQEAAEAHSKAQAAIARGVPV